MIPIFILQTWLLGLLSLSVIGGAVYLAHEFSTSDFIALKLFLGVVLLKKMCFFVSAYVASLAVNICKNASTRTKSEALSNVRIFSRATI